MRNIVVEYDGMYPNSCSGCLIIKEDEKEIYKKQHCCRSTGSCHFDKEWNEIVKDGELVWESEEAEKFDGEIREAVRDKLSSVRVCCGGCL